MSKLIEKLKQLKIGKPVGIKESAGAKYMKAMNPELQPENWGNRPSGEPKGLGYFGVLQRPSGGISTELTTSIDGIDMPLLVPTLNQKEINYLLNGGKPTKEIIKKAYEHVQKRISEGKSVYAQPGEQQ